MGEGTCGWSGCSSGAEATLDGRALCRNHFYDMAGRGLAECREQLQRIDPAGADRIAVTKILSEVISETTCDWLLLSATSSYLGCTAFFLSRSKS
jgi:hypothetical protein